MEITNTILLTIDFQKQSLIGLEYAIYFSRGTGAKIVILHVIEESGFLTKLFSSYEQQKKIDQEAQRLLNDVTTNLKKDFDVETIIEYGKVYEKVVEVAERIRPRFIMMGKTEEPSFVKRIIGSNALHVIRESKFPVISVRGNEYITDCDTNRDIVVPLDVTKETNEQLIAAIEFGKYFKSAIKIISVLDSESVRAEIQLLTRMNKAQKCIEEAGLECSAKLVKETKKPAYNVIIDYAKAEDAHLIIIMTQEQSEITNYFVGHTAQEVLSNSDIPVLSVVPWGKSDDSTFNYFVDPFGVFKA